MSFTGERRYQAIGACIEDGDESGLSVVSVLLHRVLAYGVVMKGAHRLTHRLADTLFFCLKDLRQVMYNKFGDSKEIWSEFARGNGIRISSACVPHYTSDPEIESIRLIPQDLLACARTHTSYFLSVRLFPLLALACFRYGAYGTGTDNLICSAQQSSCEQIATD